MSVLRNKKVLPFVVILLVIILVTAIFRMVSRTPSDKSRKHISMIVFGDDQDRWENMREGAGLVCENNDADLALITMMSENDTAEQEEIIQREIENGADALLIASCNSKEISDFIKRSNVRIPVVYIGASDQADEGSFITPDDYRMGYELGEEIAENESGIVTVAIISENTQRDSVRLREEGLRDAIEGKVGRIITWKGDEYKSVTKTRTFIQRAIVSEATDVIVSFDNTSTDALLDALTNLNKTSKVYSISTSEKAVYNLYGSRIKALEYPDEFSMGYLAAMNALDVPEAAKYSKKAIDYRIVRKENMYDEDNQTLLFPFVN